MNNNPTPESPNTLTIFCFASVTEQAVIERVAVLLGREPQYTDQSGYKCDLFAAAIHEPTGRVAYVESRAKKRWWSSLVDVSIKVHLREADGTDRSFDIKSYNPFFGCGVFYFEWLAETAVLIYEEKHDFYACTFGPHWPPRFVELGDYWIIKDSVLGFRDFQQAQVQRLTVPALTPLAPISLEAAKAVGLLPVNVYDKEA